MLIKIVLAVIIGAVVGGYVGHFLKCSGGSCPLTCNPWGGAIFGALIALSLVIK
jgi:hypothetical protein